MRTMFLRGARASVVVLALASFSTAMPSGSGVHPAGSGWHPEPPASASARPTPECPDRPQPESSVAEPKVPSPRTKSKATRSKAAKPKPRKRKLTRRQRVGFKMPVEGWLASGFGRRRSGYHHGIDIACPWGRKIRTARAGRVVYVNRHHPVYGRTIVIAHRGRYSTLYGHSSRIGVRVGRRVNAGQTIARCGNSGRSTGSHLHFELRRNGRYLNPTKYLTR